MSVDNDGTVAPAGGESSGDVETQAREQGWRPEAEFRGKGKWIDAQEYLNRGSAPILRERLRHAENELSRLPDLEARLKEVTDVLGEYAEHTRTVEQRSYERARKDILAEMKQAVKEGDETAFDAAQAQLETLDKDAPKPAPAKKPAAEAEPRTEPKISTVAKRWIDDPDNSWFHNNGRMNAFATAAHGDNMRDGMSEAESLKAVSEEVREKFPEHFENRARRAPGAVAQPSGRSMNQKPKGKSYDDLPAAAKAACDKFVRTIPNYTRENYVAEYDWSSADEQE